MIYLKKLKSWISCVDCLKFLYLKPPEKFNVYKTNATVSYFQKNLKWIGEMIKYHIGFKFCNKHDGNQTDPEANDRKWNMLTFFL